MDRDLNAFGGPEVDLNGVFNAALGLEREEVGVVSAVDGVDEAGLVAPGTDRALVDVPGGYLGGAGAFVGMPVDETCVLESGEGVIA